ncbi:DUF2062 domain-containing protein [Uliginosibacterium sp. H1]|uniref:DUF2062 domain-containing protein n=1 Tax=Uliginosibacterium sp. H1 TaxID=3114757 RepID=UPI002E177AAD|nr:DUF2062 domain-containing protein [Uliginosibacterium sp. H1]
MFRISPLRLLRSRPLRPHARRLLDRNLWRATPHAIGTGLGVGFFFGILIPFAQTLFAVVGAVFLRGNLLAAAGGTFVTNPFTTAPVYYGAWRLGQAITSWLPGKVVAEAEQLAEETSEVAQGLLSRLGDVGIELIIGVLVLAPVAGLLGYAAGWAGTRMWRQLRPAVASGGPAA